jgi:hypothetical protein
LSNFVTDVEVTSFTLDSNAVFPKSPKVSDEGFTVVIKNKGTTTAENIVSLSPGAGEYQQKLWIYVIT